MTDDTRQASIRNIAEVPWKQYPNHFGGALSKPLVDPEGLKSRHVDHRISSYEPMAYVARHKHIYQEQIYHVLEGQGLFEYGDDKRVVGPHDVIFIPPGIEHAFYNTGLANLIFLVITTPPTDENPSV